MPASLGAEAAATEKTAQDFQLQEQADEFNAARFQAVQAANAAVVSQAARRMRLTDAEGPAEATQALEASGKGAPLGTNTLPSDRAAAAAASDAVQLDAEESKDGSHFA